MNRINKSMRVVGISTITSNDVAAKEIGDLWSAFFKSPIKEKLKVISSSIFAVYSDYENSDKGKYRITIGYAVADSTDIPLGLTAVSIPAADYKIYPCKSRKPEDIIAAWQTIWSTDSRLLQRSFVADFEEYKDDTVAVNIGYK